VLILAEGVDAETATIVGKSHDVSAYAACPGHDELATIVPLVPLCYTIPGKFWQFFSTSECGLRSPVESGAAPNVVLQARSRGRIDRAWKNLTFIVQSLVNQSRPQGMHWSPRPMAASCKVRTVGRVAGGKRGYAGAGLTISQA
jgi:hypothetical protein